MCQKDVYIYIYIYILFVVLFETVGSDVAAFDMNPKVGVKSPPRRDIFCLQNCVTIKNIHF